MKKILLVTLALCSIAALSGRSLPLPLPALATGSQLQDADERPVYFIDIEGRAAGPEDAHTVSLPGTLLQEGEAFSLNLVPFGGEGRLEMRVERAAKRSVRFGMRLLRDGAPVIRGSIVIREGRALRLGKTITEASGCKLTMRARKI